MPRKKSGLPRKPAGRPPIDDTIDVYLRVERVRRRSTQSIHQLTRARASVYVRPVDPNSDRHLPPLKGAALRRRFAAAKRAMGLTPHSHLTPDDCEKIKELGIVLHGERTLDNVWPQDGRSPGMAIAQETADRMLVDLI